MVDLLKREVAPVTDEAWRQIDAAASRVLQELLSARRIVGFRGPLGWEAAAVNLGRLDLSTDSAAQEVPWGLRKVQPLVEVRLPVVFSTMELDAVSRGAMDIDLSPVEDAARRAARFEETAIYQGFSQAGIDGILARSSNPPIPLPSELGGYFTAISEAAKQLQLVGVPRPYALVLGLDVFWAFSAASNCGYPPLSRVRELIGGDIYASPGLSGGVLMSQSPGDFELTVGQDYSIGYTGHDREHMELFLTESFTFRVLTREASVVLKPG